MSTPEFVVVLVTASSAEEGARLGRALVEERLAACANVIGPIRSIYRWQGKIEDAAEVAAIFKTSAGAADRLITRISALHSHDVPCVVTWPIDKVLVAYAEWVEGSTQ